MAYSLTGKNQRHAMYAAATGKAIAKRSFHISYHSCCEAWSSDEPGAPRVNAQGVTLAKQRGFIDFYPTPTHRIVRLILTDKGRKELERLQARGITA